MDQSSRATPENSCSEKQETSQKFTKILYEKLSSVKVQLYFTSLFKSLNLYGMLPEP